jgi:hypothetical protein
MRLLITAGEAASDIEELPAGVRALIERAEEVLVVAPVLPDRLGWLASDTDKTKQHADARLSAILGQLEEVDQGAQGAVGSDDPLVAFEDAVAEFDPDHILIALRPPQKAGWQEKDLMEQVVSRFRLPVTAFIVDR